MSTFKRWSYQQVTTSAEARIRELRHGSAGVGELACRQWAYGVYLGWYELTVGWQKHGDAARLLALVEGDQSSPSE
ncbi:hypothetical protein [Pandoraea cepalis]|uniref:hypothetical protein n=1 Tax=Pandoraea cepalis TaxID=2508294 RepID=UPI00263A555C|nr:hypothetical protein [Pandoraea cepalis]